MRIFVTGQSGQLAQALKYAVEKSPSGEMQTEFAGRSQMDLAQIGAISKAIAAKRPELVINTAAWTAVDQAEADRQVVWRLNSEAPGEIAEACDKIGAALIHISTDYVFDGTKSGPYVETDPAAPINAYGASKYAGESAALAANRRTLVLRTSWLYSPWGKNFVRTMLTNARSHSQFRIVDDQKGTPTSAIDLAEACLAIAPRVVAAPADDPVWGVYHYAGHGTCSWADLASETFELAKELSGLCPPRIERITTGEYPTPAPRPYNSQLGCGKFENMFGIRMVPWRDALERVVKMVEAAAAGRPGETALQGRDP